MERLLGGGSTHRSTEAGFGDPLQADFTHNAQTNPELMRRIESGADIVVAEGKLQGELSRAAARPPLRAHPAAGRRRCPACETWSRVLRRSGCSRCGTPSENNEQPLLTTNGWVANAELLGQAARHARRIETVSWIERHDLRQRVSRASDWQRFGELCALGGACGATANASRGACPATRNGGGGLMNPLAWRWPCSRQRQLPLAPAAGPASYPFAVGERLTYTAKLGLVTLGSGSLEVAGIDTLRGVETSVSGSAYGKDHPLLARRRAGVVGRRRRFHLAALRARFHRERQAETAAVRHLSRLRLLP